MPASGTAVSDDRLEDLVGGAAAVVRLSANLRLALRSVTSVEGVRSRRF